MKILSIGNSFSEDGQRYLRGVCTAAGIDVQNYNLVIGGCPLVRHYNNMKGDIADYSLEIGGESTERKATMKEILTSDEWDIVTLQEVSTRSTDVRNFEPYLSELAKYVRELCPGAKIALQATWGYESDTHRIKNMGFTKQCEMNEAIEAAYAKASEIIGADYVIPSGRVLQILADKGFTVHRDGAHAGLGLGRYALALTWARTLLGISATGNTFNAFDEPVSEDEIKAAWDAVDSL